jgi:hypothetical protein
VAHNLTDLSGAPLGVVHRDVSPQNLMLNFDGCVKILDFGIALMRDRETRATQHGQLKGKPAYMAPEQLRNAPVDHRTDIFSASIVLYELLTGHHLFVGQSVYAIAMSVEASTIVPPSVRVNTLPPDLDEIAMRGLERDPDRRFQSALDMARALAGVVSKMGGEPLEQYATRALSHDRVAHLEWLQKTVAGAADARWEGRPEGVITAPLKFTRLVIEEPDDNEETTVVVRQPDFLTVKDLIRPRRTLPVVLKGALLVLLAGVCGVLGWVAWDRLGGGETPRATPGEAAIADSHPSADTPSEALSRSEQPKDEEVVLGLSLEEAPGQPPAYGFLTIAADPDVDVRIDGKPAGSTPIFRRKLPIGEHQITLISPRTGQVRLERKVELEENEHEKVILY